jgi:hypothetical protein
MLMTTLTVAITRLDTDVILEMSGGYQVFSDVAESHEEGNEDTLMKIPLMNLVWSFSLLETTVKGQRARCIDRLEMMIFAMTRNLNSLP